MSAAFSLLLLFGARLNRVFGRDCSAFTPIRGELSEADRISEEIHNLQMFLGNPQQPHNFIVHHLKTDLAKLSEKGGGCDQVCAARACACVRDMRGRVCMRPVPAT